VLPGTDISALIAAICIECGCPYFLSHPSDSSVATFGEELERWTATPTEVAHEEVETFIRVEKGLFGLSPGKERLLEIYLNDPEGSVKRLVDTLRRYHDLAIAPYWQRIQEHLEGDTLKRGQALALDECCEDFRPKAP